MYLLEKRLNRMEEYLPIKISFEAIDTEDISEVKNFKQHNDANSELF